MIVLLVGQPGSGKTTIAEAFYLTTTKKIFIVDGDRLRAVIPVGYDTEGREQNMRLAYQIARYAEAEGYLVFVALVQPHSYLRDAMKEQHGAIEVYLSGQPGERPPEYRVTGFQRPRHPDLEINTEEVNLADTLRAIHRTMADFS